MLSRPPQLATTAASAPIDPILRVLPQRQIWHNHENDRPMRQLVMLRLQRLHPVLATAAQGGSCSTQGPSLVQRLEWMLYNFANSRHEYIQECTLERRVQALVTRMNTTRTQRSVQEQHDCDGRDRQRLSGVKRGWMDIEKEAIAKRECKTDDSPTCKRQCLEARGDSEATFYSNTAEVSDFILSNDESLVCAVLSFLSGKEVLRLRSVNRFLQSVAPRAVRSLHFNTQSLAVTHFKCGTLSALLLSCTKLTSLAITSKSRVAATDPHVVSIDPLSDRASPMTSIEQRPSSTCSRHITFSASDTTVNELLLRDLASAFERGACPELMTLDLGSPLGYFADSDHVLHCLEAFVEGRLHTPYARPLRHLKLDSTYLGDERLGRLASVFESAIQSTGKSCFGALEVFVLRNNFIGEAGCQALLRLLRHMPKLRVLDLSGNILTDLDVVALADWIDPCLSTKFLDMSLATGQNIDVEVRRGSELGRPTAIASPASELQLLLLQDNYIGREGREALVRAVEARAAQSAELDTTRGRSEWPSCTMR